MKNILLKKSIAQEEYYKAAFNTFNKQNNKV